MIVLLHFWTPTTTCVFYTQHISDIGHVSVSSEKAKKYNKILGWQMCQVIQVIWCFRDWHQACPDDIRAGCWSFTEATEI